MSVTGTPCPLSTHGYGIVTKKISKPLLMVLMNFFFVFVCFSGVDKGASERRTSTVRSTHAVVQSGFP